MNVIVAILMENTDEYPTKNAIIIVTAIQTIFVVDWVDFQFIVFELWLNQV